ncbi:hypothetical protein [Streptomyces sp. NPDC047000]|uniref:hypothetical protein n=1 Tax=Streptomyces sp. NPDC047000 TaxID=3155474 RepID=UPI0033FEEAC9
MSPDTTPETAPAGVRMSDTEAAAEAARIIADAYRPAPATPTAYRDDTPLPARGNAPPVVQPGRPPMSQRAVDASTLMLSAGAASLPVGAVAVSILLASGQADPAVIGMICAAPAGAVLAAGRLLRRAKDAMPDVHHHHYDGPVHQDQRTITTRTTGIWAKTTNHDH